MIDWTHLKNLRSDVGSDGFDEIVELFFLEVEEVFARIKHSDPHPNDMHFLKGSAANLGFVEFAKSCKTAQRALQNQETIDLDALQTQFAVSKGAFETGQFSELV
jgi:HPt (histidine-containing phosphotransfer) domain-containing protein